MKPRNHDTIKGYCKAFFDLCIVEGEVIQKVVAVRRNFDLPPLIPTLIGSTYSIDTCLHLRQGQKGVMQRAIPSFSGFATPNYTMVPDQVFDELLTELSGGELKVLLYVIRRTFGFKKERDAISLNQMLHGITTREGQVLDRGCGLSKPTLLTALRSLVDRGIVVVQRRRSLERGDEATVYSLRMKGEKDPEPEPPGEVQRPPKGRGGKETLPGGWSKKLTTQDTVIQETEISNIRKENLEKNKAEDVYAETTLVIEDDGARGSQSAQGYANQNKPPLRVSGDFVALAEPLKHRHRINNGRGSGERDAVLSCIEQFAQEFDDKASLKSSTSRAYNLLTQSALSKEAFVLCMWEARAITRERSTHVTSKMSYFFSVLSERLGLSGAKKKNR